MPDVLTERFTVAMERMADALEFFVGIHPAYEPTEGKPPLPSSPQARAIAKAHAAALAVEAEAKKKEEAAAAAQLLADELQAAQDKAEQLQKQQTALKAADEKAEAHRKLLSRE